jgi:hypothetical protein
MVTARELRIWSLTLQQWAARLGDVQMVERAERLADDLYRLALCTEIRNSSSSELQAPR